MRDGRSVIRRRRAILAGLVALAIVFLTGYFGEGGGGVLHALRSGGQTVLSPIQEGASRALKPVRDLSGWVGDTFRAKGDNEELRVEVERLRALAAAAEVNARDADQLRRIVDLEDERGYPDGASPVTARVIAQPPTSWFSKIQIDKGSSAGIERDQPVVTAGGLAGKITDTTAGTATVTLVTDSSSAVSAQIMPKGVRGVVRAQVGDPDDLLVDFLEKDEQLREGNTVLTSGSTSSRFESLFPRGIPIGKVTRLESDEAQLYQRVHMRPFADLRKIDFVQVLTGDAQPAAEAAGLSGSAG